MKFEQYQIDHFQDVIDSFMKEEQESHLIAETARSGIADYLVAELDWVESAKVFRNTNTVCVSLIPTQSAIESLGPIFDDDLNWIESKYVGLQSIIDRVVTGSYNLDDYLKDAE